MYKFGLWILITFGLSYLIMLLTGSKKTIGSLILGAILALGIVLSFIN